MRRPRGTDSSRSGRCEQAERIPRQSLHAIRRCDSGHARRDPVVAGARTRSWLGPADLYLPHGSHPWNPNLLACLYRRGIVEQLGSGTLRMVRKCADAGLGRPVFTSTSASVRCSVPRRGHWLGPDGAGLAVTRLEAAVLTALAERPAARGELADDLEVSVAEVREALVQLRDLGLVLVEGHGRARTGCSTTPSDCPTPPRKESE